MLFEYQLTARRIGDGAGAREGHTKVDIKITVRSTKTISHAERAEQAHTMLRNRFGEFMTDAYRWSVAVYPV